MNLKNIIECMMKKAPCEYILKNVLFVLLIPLRILFFLLVFYLFLISIVLFFVLHILLSLLIFPLLLFWSIGNCLMAPCFCQNPIFYILLLIQGITAFFISIGIIFLEIINSLICHETCQICKKYSKNITHYTYTYSVPNSQESQREEYRFYVLNECCGDYEIYLEWYENLCCCSRNKPDGLCLASFIVLIARMFRKFSKYIFYCSEKIEDSDNVKVL